MRSEHVAGQGPRAEADARERELEALRAEVATLRGELARHEADAQLRASQLERYAADLRDTFKQERARTQELRASYRATVRALADAVEARDAYTGRHACLLYTSPSPRD